MHKTIHSLVTCLYWEQTPVVLGDGPVAVIERCDHMVITLFESVDDAQRRLERLQSSGCGERCIHDHELVVILTEFDLADDRESLSEPSNGSA